MKSARPDDEDSPVRNGVVFNKIKEFEEKKQAARRQKISALKISNRVPNIRILDYCDEAENSFVYGSFRSSIICSAIAAELSLKHSLIFSSEDWEETHWNIEAKEVDFYNIIKILGKKTPELAEVLSNADWLRRVRNKIVAHPLYIGTSFDIERPGTLKAKSLEHMIWATRTMLRDLKKLLQYVEPDKKKEIEEKPFSRKTPEGEVLEKFSVKDFLNLRKPARYEHSDFIYWKAIQNELVEEIAYLAYTRIVGIVNAIFPER